MCSFIFTNKEIVDLKEANKFTSLRGPDMTTIKKIGDFNYVHNLLSITGNIYPQPIEKEGVVCVYNGEIYNYMEFGNFPSDGESIIDSYIKHGDNFTKYLDGEFAIVLVDRNLNKCIISSDIFKTKPMFYSIDNKSIGVSTYSEPLRKIGHQNIKKFPPNTTIVIDLNTYEATDRFNVNDFDISSQFKDNFDDFNYAFKESIRKRTSNLREKIFIGLSSGYDSGAICNELIKQNREFKSFIVRGSENEDILQKRIDILNLYNKEHQILLKTDPTINETVDYIKRNTEEFKYTISSSSSGYNEYWLSLTDDYGSKYMSYICYNAKNQGYKILLSGTGPDEIFSDYGFNGHKFMQHSNFGGLFPDDLSTIFPWNSFYGSSMESYIAKEEYVGGSFGIEVRYPFLDKKVVQEFLWLTKELKNSTYKAPIDQYLKKNKYPFNKNVKQGF